MCTLKPYNLIARFSSTETENHEVESSKILNERFKLGIKSVPPELSQYNSSKAREDWNKDRAFENDLPPSMKEISDDTENLLKIILGRNYSKMVRGIRIWGGTAYSPGDGKVLVPQFFSLSNKYFVMLMLHEALGHGTDPAVFLAPENGFKYPPEIFYNLEIAKWQMLSQSWSVPGEYLNLPEDEIHKVVWATSGRAVVEKYYFDNKNFSNLEGALKLKELMDQTASELNMAPDTIVYTKKFNYLLGQKIQIEMANGSEFFIQNSYEDNLSGSLVEIFAEMIKWSLLPKSMLSDDPRGLSTATKTQNNPIIQAAVRSWLENIRGETVDLDNVREDLYKYYLTLPPVIPPPVPKVGSIAPTQSATPMVSPTLTHDQMNYQKAQEIKDQFLVGQKLPPTQDTVLSTYLNLYLEIDRIYPRAGEEHGDPERSILVFDPPTLNVWETEKITQAMRNSRLDNLFLKIAKKEALLQIEKDELAKDIETLKFYLVKGF